VANILSQDEVDALLNSFSDEEDGVAEAEPELETKEAPKADRSVAVFDFRRPNRISKDQLRFLETLHETYVNRLTGVLSGYLRTMVEMEILSVEQLTYGEWVQSLPESTCLFPFAMEPLQGSGAIEFNQALGLSVVDRLLGGQGSALDRVRELTHLEETILSQVARQSLEVLREVWGVVTEIRPRLEGFEKLPNMLKLLPDPETVVLVTLEIKTQTLNGALTFCYPFVSLERVLNRASAGAYAVRAIRPRRTEQGVHWLTQGLEEGRVPLRVQFAEGEITIGEFIHLRKGDIVRMKTKVDEPLRVDLGGKGKFAGRAGQVGRKLAVQILGRLAEPEDEPVIDPDEGGDADDGRSPRTETGNEQG
jgi:flagellar motor switch protein FliM